MPKGGTFSTISMAAFYGSVDVPPFSDLNARTVWLIGEMHHDPHRLERPVAIAGKKEKKVGDSADEVFSRSLCLSFIF